MTPEQRVLFDLALEEIASMGGDVDDTAPHRGDVDYIDVKILLRMVLDGPDSAFIEFSSRSRLRPLAERQYLLDAFNRARRMLVEGRWSP